MEVLDQLFELRVKSNDISDRLTQFDDSLHNELEELFLRSERLTLELTQKCKAATGIIGSKLVTKDTVSKLKKESDSLERLLVVAEKANARLIDKKQSTEYGRLFEKICTFIDSYQHFLDIYGFSLLSSQDHLTLGQDVSGNYITIPNEKRRTHLFMIGRTGKGKSEAMIGFALQDILSGGDRGGILADPFGSMARKVGAFALAYDKIRDDFLQLKSELLKTVDSVFDDISDKTQEEIRQTNEFEKFSLFKDLCEADIDKVFPRINVKIIDLSKKNKNNPYRINPFSPSDSLSIQDTVSILMDAIANEMGQRKQETATAKNVLESLFGLIASNGGSLNDILFELNSLRRYSGSGQGMGLMPEASIENLKNSDEPFCQNAADYLTHLLSFKGNNFAEMINSSRSRISLLVNSRLCHAFFNTQKTTLDLESIINSEEPVKPFIVLNIPHDEEGAGVVSQYLLRLIEKLLYERTDKQKQNTWYMYFDEMHRFLGESALSASAMSDKFTSLRQHGGALHVAMQTGSQLKKDDPSGYVFDAIVESCSTKIVFSSGVNDANYFAESLFSEKGNMHRMVFSCSQGKGESITVNSSTGKTEGSSYSESQSNTLSEGMTRTLGNTVSDTFSRTLSQSEGHTSTSGNSSGSTNSRSTGISQRRNEDITEKSSSVLGASIQQSSSSAKTSNKGSSESTGSSNSRSESEAKSQSQANTTGHTSGISESTSKTMGAAQAINGNVSFSATLQPVSISEEIQFLSQEISRLDSRECFISSGSSVKKSVSLDSLIIKVEKKIGPYSENFYSLILEQNIAEQSNLKSPEDLSQSQEQAHEAISGVDQLF